MWAFELFKGCYRVVGREKRTQKGAGRISGKVYMMDAGLEVSSHEVGFVVRKRIFLEGLIFS